jgi:hypothetical protein
LALLEAASADWKDGDDAYRAHAYAVMLGEEMIWERG